MKKILLLLSLVLLFASCVRNPITQKVNLHNNRVEKGLSQCIELFEPLKDTEIYKPVIEIVTSLYYVLIEKKVKPEDAAFMAAKLTVETLENEIKN